MVTLHNHAFFPPYGQYLPHVHNYITHGIRLQFLSENRFTLLSYSSFFLSSVDCPFSAKPMSIEFIRNNLNLVKQSYEALSAKSFHSGQLFSDHTLVNPPPSIHNRVSWSQRHPLCVVGQKRDFETSCWRTYWSVQGFPFWKIKNMLYFRGGIGNNNSTLLVTEQLPLMAQSISSVPIPPPPQAFDQIKIDYL